MENRRKYKTEKLRIKKIENRLKYKIEKQKMEHKKN